MLKINGFHGCNEFPVVACQTGKIKGYYFAFCLQQFNLSSKSQLFMISKVQHSISLQIPNKHQNGGPRGMLRDTELFKIQHLNKNCEHKAEFVGKLGKPNKQFVAT